tara:strand:- start:12144 stop:13418 length:1275 start_codon:yes stop_codon:yes gene_type:complete
MSKIIFHGSSNSQDKDAYYIVESPISISESNKISKKFPDLDLNFITVKNNKVDWVLKGIPDETNNGILDTYKLHKQLTENPIKKRVKRDYGIKILRTIRGILSHYSRTKHRNQVKKGLKTIDFNKKLDYLSNIDIENINEFEKKSDVETFKFIAFQLGQTLALIKDNKELYTKDAVANYYPDLADFIYRKPSNQKYLKECINEFINFCQQNIDYVEKFDEYMAINIHNKNEVIDVKKEKLLPPVVIFDLDNTLYDCSHRMHYIENIEKRDPDKQDTEEDKLLIERNNKRWHHFFSECDQDIIISKVRDMLLNYKNKGYEIWILSGRSEPECLEKTTNKLKKDNIPYDHIKLRGYDSKKKRQLNMIPDHVLKPAWARKYIGLQRIEAVFDDLPKVLEGYEKKGLNAIDIKPIIKSDKPFKKFKNN